MKRRILRGGSYYFDSRYLRTASLYFLVPEDRYRLSGFRLVVVRRKR